MVDLSGEPDTHALLCAANEGDSEAKDQLFARHRNRLKRMVSVRMHPWLTARFDASDVVQEALIQAASRLPEYLSERPIDFYPWLRRITYERLVDLHRHHFDREKRSVKREVAPSFTLPNESSVQLVDFLVDRNVGPRSQMVRDELRQRIRVALDALPEKYREVLVLRHLEQLTTEETASVLGVANATVKTRYYRAISRMHDSLEEAGGGTSVD